MRTGKNHKWFLPQKNTSNSRRIEATKAYNDFQAQTRTRVESGVKLILLVSGSMLTLSVGAILNGTPPPIPTETLPTLQCAWLLLFYSIAAALGLMVSLIISTYHMGQKWGNLLNNLSENDEPKTIKTWPLLEFINWVLGISGAIACLAGLLLMSQVAIEAAAAVIR